MTVTSRHFGDIDPHRPVPHVTVSTVHGYVDVEPLIAENARFAEVHATQTDAAVDALDALDDRVRTEALRALSGERSVPAEIYANRNDLEPSRPISPEAFASGLRLSAAVISPLGGEAPADRVALTYASTARHLSQTLRAVVREGAGLVFIGGAAPDASGGQTWR